MLIIFTFAINVFFVVNIIKKIFQSELSFTAYNVIFYTCSIFS